MRVDKKRLGEIHVYFRAREQQLFDCFAHLDNLLEDAITEILNPEDGTYDGANPVTCENIRRIELNANTFRYSMLVAVCAFHEEVMVAIGKLAVPDYETKLKPLKGSWIARHTALLTNESGIDFTSVNTLVERLSDLWTVRNCIVHAWGNANSAKDQAELRAAVARLNTVTIHCVEFTEDNELYFTLHDTVSTALSAADDLVDFLVEKLST